MFYVKLKNVFFSRIILLSLLPEKLVVAARRIKLFWCYLSILYNGALSALNFFLQINFSFENFLSWLSSMVTFNILVIILSLDISALEMVLSESNVALRRQYLVYLWLLRKRNTIFKKAFPAIFCLKFCKQDMTNKTQ